MFWMGGYATPFDLAAIILGLGAWWVKILWSENTGKSNLTDLEKEQEERSLNEDGTEDHYAGFKKAWNILKNDKNVLHLGLMIAFFESSMFIFVFLWTPPHFWALALFMKSDYAAAGVPMLPVVSGERTTRTQIGLYTIPMAAVAILPWPLGLTGAIYGIAAVLLTGWFALLAVRVAKRTTHADDAMKPEKALFKYSILYLFVMFGALVVDRWFA